MDVLFTGELSAISKAKESLRKDLEDMLSSMTSTEVTPPFSNNRLGSAYNTDQTEPYSPNFSSLVLSVKQVQKEFVGLVMGIKGANIQKFRATEGVTNIIAIPSRNGNPRVVEFLVFASAPAGKIVREAIAKIVTEAENSANITVDLVSPEPSISTRAIVDICYICSIHSRLHYAYPRGSSS